jgi:hypothetical protein
MLDSRYKQFYTFAFQNNIGQVRFCGQNGSTVIDLLDSRESGYTI